MHRIPRRQRPFTSLDPDKKPSWFRRNNSGKRQSSGTKDIDLDVVGIKKEMYGRQVEGRYGQRLIPMTSPAYNSTDPMIKEEGASNGDLLHVAEEYLDGH